MGINLDSSFQNLKEHGDKIDDLIDNNENFIDNEGLKSIRKTIKDLLNNASSFLKTSPGEIYNKFNGNYSKEGDKTKNAFPFLTYINDLEEEVEFKRKSSYNGPYLKVAKIKHNDNKELIDLKMSKNFNIDSQNVKKSDLSSYNITGFNKGDYNLVDKPADPADIPNCEIINIKNTVVYDQDENIPFNIYEDEYIDNDGNTVKMVLKVREG